MYIVRTNMHATSQMFAFASKYLEFEKEIRSLAPISQQKI